MINYKKINMQIFVFFKIKYLIKIKMLFVDFNYSFSKLIIKFIKLL